MFGSELTPRLPIMTLIIYLSLKVVISFMQFRNTSIMDISDDLFSVSLSLVVASEHNSSLFSRLSVLFKSFWWVKALKIINTTNKVLYNNGFFFFQQVRAIFQSSHLEIVPLSTKWNLSFAHALCNKPFKLRFDWRLTWVL